MSSLHTYAWRKARAHVLAYATHCALCGKPLDFSAAPRTRWAPSVDHIIAREVGGTDHLSNLQPAHHGCNSRKGMGAAPRLVTSRDW